jgi:hypothetical protein
MQQPNHDEAVISVLHKIGAAHIFFWTVEHNTAFRQQQDVIEQVVNLQSIVSIMSAIKLLAAAYASVQGVPTQQVLEDKGHGACYHRLQSYELASGAGCSSARRIVASRRWQKLRRMFTIWNVVLESNPVEISSIISALTFLWRTWAVHISSCINKGTARISCSMTSTEDSVQASTRGQR